MLNFSSTRNIIIKLIIAVIFTSLNACKDGSQNNNAYLQVSIAGSNAQTKIQRNAPGYSQDTTVNILPDGITRITFVITDSKNIQTKTSLTVGSQTQKISLRVVANRELNIAIEALTGNTVSFRGQRTVSALRPGQSFPLSVSLDEVGVPNIPVVISINPNSSKFEGDTSMSNLTFNVSLSALANGKVTVDYSANGLTAIDNIDFSPTVGTLIIPAGELLATITIPIIGDTDQEPDESLVLTLSNASANATLDNAVATGFIISDDFPGRLNDTGVVLCGDYSLALTDLDSNTTSNNSINCNSSGTSQTELGVDQDDDIVPAGQDALYGRDASENVDSDGVAGFIFTKLDANGSPLADQTLDYDTQPWTCVKDNYTGLIWEVKTISGLQNTSSVYAWLNTTGVNDGGDPGLADNTTGCVSNSGCDTEAYVVDMNAIAACGANNWRLPTVTELLSIVNNGGTSPTIDNNYFHYTAGSGYWTSSPQALNSSNAWVVNFDFGIVDPDSKQNTRAIRLVHDEFIPQQF